MKIKLPRPSLADDVQRSLRSIVGAMGDAFGLVESYLSRTARSQVVVMSVAIADRPFIVAHSLGTRPTFAFGYGAVNAHTYTTDDDLREWNDKTIKLRYPSTGRVTIRVEA